jgi:selenocysteine lyase/cysteine desulfurase
VPVFGGGVRRYVNLDNAATTPVFKEVWELLSEVMPFYGSVHRGSGFKSLVSTQLFEDSAMQILRFAGGDSDRDTIVFGVNTTSCINHLARRLDLGTDSVVVTSELEHSSNLLPWRKHCRVVQCPSTSGGGLDLDALESILKQGSVSLVAITAASNVTGQILPVASIARVAHHSGTQVFVDASQLAGHRRIDRRSPDSEEHLDFVAFCAHKMYAPFGLGVLIGPAAPFEIGWPDEPGGGNVKLIDGERTVWANLPDREQGGTPNFPGVVALAASCRILNEIGFDVIANHEVRLLARVQERSKSIERLDVYRKLTGQEDSVGIVPFNVDGYHHSLIGAYLGYECGIGVRTGLFCQYSLIRHLLGISEAQQATAMAAAESGDMRNVYGLVRASCGIGTKTDDIDTLFDCLSELRSRGPKGIYRQALDGHFDIEGWEPAFPAFMPRL